MESEAQSLVGNIGKLVGQEFWQLRGVGGEVARLRNELATINALLRMQSEADEGAVDHFVREWMKQLREVGYDAEDCIDIYLLRVRSRPGDPFLVWSKRLLKTLWARHCLAGDIRDLRALAADINEQHARYGVSLEPLRRTPSSDTVQPAAVAATARDALAAGNGNGNGNGNDAPTTELVGIQSQAIELAEKIKALNEDDDKKLKVFSIWGLGGLGKTTLAMEVCRKLRTEFQHQAQVSVSQTFSVGKDLQGLLKRVLRQIAESILEQTAVNSIWSNEEGPLAKIDSMDVGNLHAELTKRLDGKRYLILIDDVWTITAWDAIRSKLPDSTHGSRVIVTTRKDTVARACSNSYHMKELNYDDSEKLFVSKAFGSAGNQCPDDLNVAMKSILKKCGGLPLAIVSIASMLASYKPPEGKKMWETVEKSIGSQMETNPTLEGMRQILTLSYNELPHHLKACMMYLSIFPDDYMVCKDRLLKRWIAEGLVAEKRGLTQMELAESCFSELMNRSMIDWADEREDRCRVHDMMLEILVSKSLEANFVSLVGGQYEGMSYDSTIRRLSIHGGLESHEHSSSSKKKTEAFILEPPVPRDRSWWNREARRMARIQTWSGCCRMSHGSQASWGSGIKGTVQHVRSLSIFDPNAHKLLARLHEFTLLRVLDLEDCQGLEEKHMSCICQMYLLRFLSLKGTDIKELPSGVGDLEHLQTLDVRQTDLKDLPETVKKLEKLEHLLFSNKDTSSHHWSGWLLTQGINKMKALRQLNRVVVIGKPEVAEDIGELNQLQELAIYVDTREKTVPEDVVQKLAFSLSKLYLLRWLDIGNFGCGKWPFAPVMDFLHKVDPPPRLLRYLKIWGHIHKLPQWMESLTDLVELDIAWTYIDGVGLFSVLHKLPNLKRLSLGAYFIWHRQDMVARHSQPFPKLKELTLGYSPEVPPAYRFEEASMPELETLVVNFGDQHKEIVGIEHLKSLKVVQYSGYKEKMGHAVEQLEELNKRDTSKQITVRARYEGDIIPE